MEEQIREILHRSISSLGGSVKSAETKLVRQKIRGVPKCAHGCLLANYFKAQLCSALKVLPSDVVTSVTSLAIAAEVKGARASQDSTKLLQSIIEKFDAGLLDKRLYPVRSSWTPPIGGWHYRVEYQRGLATTGDECPLNFNSMVISGRLAGWRIVGVRGAYIDMQSAYAECLRLRSLSFGGSG